MKKPAMMTGLKMEGNGRQPASILNVSDVRASHKPNALGGFMKFTRILDAINLDRTITALALITAGLNLLGMVMS
ncbi:hypothetical protein [Aeromonas sp. ASNIH5]|uniref:hypothetical protein n=1 Tax=Aeromonas sp. ASNIH5 TaxID=1758179 RepID=UPI000CD32980|nr:hypothetical protein [Aeromonas sp. ASNIH5]AUT44087.1 hypothetical protein C2U30_22055 [Aeromonas sp. ASNIH5]